MVKIKAKKNKEPLQIANKQDDNVVILPPVRMSDDPTPKQVPKVFILFKVPFKILFIFIHHHVNDISYV